MATGLHKHDIYTSNLWKCGEIFASVLESKNEFYLSCEFCGAKYHQLNNFIQHIYDKHLTHFPSIVIKQETTSPPDYCENDLDCCIQNKLYDNLEMLESHKESGDTHIMSNFFETVLLDRNDVEIKAELSQTINNELITGQMEINNVVTSDEEKLTSDSEITQKKENSQRKKPQRNYKPRARDIKITDANIDVSQCIILAEVYKKHTCLWNEKDISYRFNNKREEALASARDEFNEKTGLNLTEYNFEIEVIRLRKICSYEKKQKIICSQNKKEHKSSCKYYNYIEYLEVDVAPFVCSICGEQHRVLGKLKVHEATHDGSLPFKCDICGRGFRVGINLTRHLRRHERDRRFYCDVCSKAFITPQEVVLHMRTHTGEKPYVCHVCGTKYAKSSSLVDHIMRSHQKERRFKCDICSKAFYSPPTLKEHKNSHKKVRDYICEVCEKAFKSRKHLTQHNRIHDSVKRYICKICGKRFAQAAGLCGHMKSHGTIWNTNSADNNLK
ncbi:zinc finger protein 382-like isoform X3 [Eurosta solidaginis]|uniref:zinc finger protein 382-like isoform X1 n=1 Tax=Eurosta solidaginis TaxID=178769 RepID=UPI0035308CF3